MRRQHSGCWTNACRRFAVACCALVAFVPFGAHAAALGAAQLEIIAADSARLPAVELTLHVRDASGHGVNGLQASAFSVEEQGRTIPGEQVQLAPSDATAASLSVAIVADTSALLGAQALSDIRADARSLIEQLTDQTGSTSIGLFVPRSGATDADQRIEALPFTTDRTNILAAIDQLGERSGQTDLYNAVVAAINASADAAAQRGGPAYVVVLSDGLDRTSIVGAGQNGANEAAQIAETRRVRVMTLGYGAALKRGSPLLTQLADRASGRYQANPSAQLLNELAAELRSAANGGTYTLRFTSALPADGAKHPITVRVRLNDQTLDAESQVLAPRPWDSTTPLQSDMQLDARGYPTLRVTTRPLNRLRRTVPDVAASDIQLMLDGKPLRATLTVANEPLDIRAPEAAQSVALVVDQSGPNARKLREQARMWLQAPDEVPSRVALFLPGVATGTPQFTHDHNASINALNAAVSAQPRAEIGPTLLQAIDAAARDGDAAQRPAYVILFADQPFAPSDRAQAATLARDLGVAIATIAPSAEIDRSLVALAAVTDAAHLVDPDEAALRGLAQRIQQDRATHYVITGDLPIVADGGQHTLGLAIRGVTTEAPFTALVAGAANVRQPVAPALLGLAALGCSLLLVCAAVLPRIAFERRRRCPTCGRFRRASWGNSCLFCERELASGVSSHGSEMPLAGFAQQGALILQQAAIPPAEPIAPEVVPAVAADGHADAAQQPSNTDFWGPLPASARGLEERAAAYAFEQPEAARSDTDFWGPLPQTAAIPSAEPAQLPARSIEVAQPLPEVVPVASEPAGPAHQPAHADTTVPSIPAIEQPVSGETGFWGPIEPVVTAQRKEAKP